MIEEFTTIMRWTIKRKLVATFLLVLLLTGAGMVLGILNLRHSNETLGEIANVLAARVDAARQLEVEQAEFNIVLRDYVSAPDATDRAAGKEDITRIRAAMSASIERLNQLADEAGRPMIARYSEQWNVAAAINNRGGGRAAQGGGRILPRGPGRTQTSSVEDAAAGGPCRLQAGASRGPAEAGFRFRPVRRNGQSGCCLPEVGYGFGAGCKAVC
ncbi:MCP four helix bundle domain-containing protein [Cereibacter sphaeroides]|nr:MCP four helix bundle domain-containing protein [Cereibacter sphaeroides]